MINDLKPYPEYKESGLPWLGQVPGHWEERRLRSLTTESICNGVGESAQEFREYWPRYIRITDIADVRNLRRRTRASLPPSLAFGADVRQGDLLIAAVGATYGKAYVHSSDDEACFAGYLVRVRLSAELDPGFAAYWTESQHYWHQLRANVIQSTIQNFSAARVKRLLAIVPPPDEQAAIVRFLDWVIGRLERAIRAKRKVIALLNEQKQAISHRAVTRGLDNSVPLKDSGVPWIGEIPEHWEVQRTKNVFRLRTQKSGLAHGLELLSIYTHIGVRPRKDLEQKGNKASTTDNYWMVWKGDLIVNKLLAWMGAIGVSDYEGVTSPAYDILMPIRPLCSGYYHHLFRTKLYLRLFKQRSRGIMDMRLRLYFDQLGQILVPFPPVEEQAAIVASYVEATADLTSTIYRLEREITLLREYRTRLVADVVTGKLDVREAAARLPKEELVADEALYDPFDQDDAEDSLECESFPSDEE